ncbi:hypothetical protein AB3S75_000082 [Citrus x aurantiifolia]
MERCPDFNPLKYSRDVYYSHWGKEADCLHSNLIEEGNTPTMHCGGSNCCSPSWRAAALTTRPKAEWLHRKFLHHHIRSASWHVILQK